MTVSSYPILKSIDCSKSLRKTSLLIIIFMVIVGLAVGATVKETKAESNVASDKVLRIAFGIGPTGGVEEKTENDLHNQALDHWEEVTKKKCVGVPAEDCEAIPEKVQNYYDKNPSDEPAKVPGTFDLVKIQDPMVEEDDGTGIIDSGLDLADLDGDGYPDLGAMGKSDNGEDFLLYENDGTGHFDNTTFSAAPTPAQQEAAVAFGDLTGNSSNDLVVAGGDDNTDGILKVYHNDGSGNFNEVEEPLGSDTGLGRAPAVNLADVDNDGDLDLIAQGWYGSRIRLGLFVFHNDGTGSFGSPEQNLLSDTSLAVGGLGVADLNGNGQKDLVASGFDDGAGEHLFVFKNTGSGTFTLDQEPMKDLNDGTGVTNEQNGLELADFDDDGDRDLLLAGYDENVDTRLVIYENDGSGQFTSKLQDFSDTYGTNADGDVAVADFTQDGTMEFAASGNLGTGSPKKLVVFDRNASGKFEVILEPFKDNDEEDTGVDLGEITTGDIDDDDDPDLIVSGQDNSGQKRLIVFENQVFK
ncbi:MAG: FG-GAP repeat domain-containing protein [bacterium]